MKAKLIKLQNGEYDLLVDTNLKSLEGTKLSLRNCQAIERSYDLDELAKTIFSDKTFTTDEEHETPIDGSPYQWGFKVGFQKCLELMGDKKFTEKDMEFMFACGRNYQASADSDCRFTNVIQSLQQTEWDVEVEMETIASGNIIVVDHSKNPFEVVSETSLPSKKERPKLDAEGCLILKRL